MDENLMQCIVLVIMFTAIYLETRNSRKRRWWERPHLGPNNRQLHSQASFLKYASINDTELFFKYLRFTPDQFNQLTRLIGPLLLHHSFSRETINPSTRLAVTLRYLVSGESQRSLALNYRLGDSTIHQILYESLRAIPNVLKPIVMPEFNTQNLKKISDGFWSRWNFPHCCGACDGKHVRIKKPCGCGSEFYNYKGYHSVVLMAVCDHEYKFIFADVGSEGRQNDSAIFKNSKLGKSLQSKQFPLPAGECVKNGPFLPYYLLGDAAFALTEYMITPFARSQTKLPDYKEIFNYRQSRARRVIENAFGILVTIFRIFKTEIDLDLKTLDFAIMSTVCLHNFRLIENKKVGVPLPQGLVDRDVKGKLVDGSWRSKYDYLDQIGPQHGRHSKMSATTIRNELASFFVSEDGAVPWQYSIVS